MRWKILLWLIRHADDKSLTVARSQERLAAELCGSARHIRRSIAFWRSVGVLRVSDRGGGLARRPSRYVMDLPALEVYSLRESDRLSPRQEKNSGHVGGPGGNATPDTLEVRS